MLESVKISRRQSEIRQALAGLVGKESPDENEVRSMSEMDAEYRANETRYRAALIAEDTERRDAGKELETRGDREYSDLVSRFEIRQIVGALNEGRALTGPTNEVVTEMRGRGGYKGFPVPLMALEQRAGETIASGTPDPIQTRPIIDRLFPASVAGRMGAELINIDAGAVEYPIVTSSISAGWAATELGNIAGPTVFSTADRALKPEQNLGIQVKISRRALLQSGSGLEQAIRRDLNGAIGSALDKAVFQGSGASGEPLGVIPGVATYGITLTAVGAAASWAAFRAAIRRFMIANAATGPGDVMLLIHPGTYDYLDGQLLTSTDVSQWDRLLRNVPAANIAMSSNAVMLTAGTPDTSEALLTTRAGGTSPIMIGVWGGGLDLIRDPYVDAASGGLRLTALMTTDVQVPRGSQLEVLTDLQVE
jgi:HK97 family phage major capsid protein